jgi:predicted dehydrogenase
MEKLFQVAGSGIKVGVIGFGYWGPNIVRNFDGVRGFNVCAICDRDLKACEHAIERYPSIEVTAETDKIIKSTDIDVVAVVTPVSTHYELAKKALQNSKHVFIEKPFTSTVAQAEELITLAQKKHLQIMVDHTLLFTGAVRKIKEIIDTLGRLYYYDSVRINLGMFQHDVNVIWDLAPHDLSIMDYLIGARPSAVSAVGFDHLNRGLANTAYVTVYFDDMIAHLNLNWLSPVKIRHTLIGGRKKMLVWNDLEPDEKVKIYDRGIDVSDVRELLISYRSGDMHAPKIDHTEALRTEVECFLRCIESGEAPVNDGRAGLRIVKLLEATDRSLKGSGRIVGLSL